MVSVNTGEILAVANGVGESTRTGTSLIGAGGGAGPPRAALIDMTQYQFRQHGSRRGGRTTRRGSSQRSWTAMRRGCRQPW